MYGAFTDNAKLALFNANCVANEVGQECIGTAHILIAILHDDTAIASRALVNLGVDVAALRSDLDQSINAATDNESTEPLISASRSKHAIELALALAGNMKHQLVDCEHFLLGLIQEGEGLAARILSKHGVTFEAAQAEVARLRAAGR